MELTNLQKKLLSLIDKNGLATTSVMVGGYDVLRTILKGVNFLTKDLMLKTIYEVCNELGSFSLEYLGLEPIVMSKNENTITKLEVIYSERSIVVTYLSGGVYVNDYLIKNSDIDTIHLYEIVDALMDQYENNQ